MADKELCKLVTELKRTFEGDSNDAEHDAAVELVDYLEAHVIQEPLRGTRPTWMSRKRLTAR